MKPSDLNPGDTVYAVQRERGSPFKPVGVLKVKIETVNYAEQFVHARIGDGFARRCNAAMVAKWYRTRAEAERKLK